MPVRPVTRRSVLFATSLAPLASMLHLGTFLQRLGFARTTIQTPVQPAWKTQQKLQGGTDAVPAIIACGTTLFMAWRGIGNDHSLWISSSLDGQTWTPQRVLPDAASLTGPSLAWDGTRLWMAWQGSAGDDGIYWATSTDLFVHNSSGIQHLVDRASSHSPAIAIIDGTPTMVWKGMRDDQALYLSTFNGSWTGQRFLERIGTAAAPALCQDLSGGVRLVWRGMGDDQALWTAKLPATGFVVQQRIVWSIPGSQRPAFAAPASEDGPALILAHDRIVMAWRGVKGDNALYFNQLTTAWSPQAPIPRVAGSVGVSLADRDGTLHAVWKGIGTDPGIYLSTL